MLMSTLTPGGLSLVMMATVETMSTSVAVNPPCMKPPRFKWDSSTITSQVHFPGTADATSNYANRAEQYFMVGLGELWSWTQRDLPPKRGEWGGSGFEISKENSIRNSYRINSLTSLWKCEGKSSSQCLRLHKLWLCAPCCLELECFCAYTNVRKSSNNSQYIGQMPFPKSVLQG